jgi:hypothetical protein
MESLCYAILLLMKQALFCLILTQQILRKCDIFLKPLHAYLFFPLSAMPIQVEA